jgi:hypothetical protein
MICFRSIFPHKQLEGLATIAHRPGRTIRARILPMENPGLGTLELDGLGAKRTGASGDK